MKKKVLFATWYLLLAITLVASIQGSLLLWERFRPAKFEELTTVAFAQTVDEVEPVSVTFPKFEMQIPVVKGQIQDDQWSIAEDAASFVSMETATGSGWIIYGHNYPRILSKLDGVKVGDLVEITTTNGEALTYEVTEKVLVYPEYTDSILPSDSEPLVIYTCSGFLDSKRLVVRAKLVE